MRNGWVGIAMVVCLLAGRAVAQQGSATAACGDEKVQFDVATGKSGQDVTVPAEGKAQIYFVELFDVHDKHRLGRPTIRQGLDGAWLGATQGFTFLRTEVAPGAHHLCSRWQSHFARLTDEVSLNNFVAEAGKTYYFRLQIVVQGGSGDAPGSRVIDLQPVSEDEGRFLVNQAKESLSKPK